MQTYNPATGACGYGALPEGAWPYGSLAAIDPAASPLAAGTTQQGCGICLEVQCTDASACGSAAQPLVVLVTDFCEGCGAGSIYLAPAAYAKLAPGLPLGQVSGRFRRVRPTLLGGGCVASRPSPEVQPQLCCSRLARAAPTCSRSRAGKAARKFNRAPAVLAYRRSTATLRAACRCTPQGCTLRPQAPAACSRPARVALPGGSQFDGPAKDPKLPQRLPVSSAPSPHPIPPSTPYPLPPTPPPVRTRPKSSP